MFKYGLQTLLFIVLCVAGFLGVYRVGLDRGYASGQAKWRAEQYLPRAYFVQDLAGPSGPFSTEDIEKLIQEIDPACWDFAGGPASSQLLVDRNGKPVFVIKADSSLHERIAETLAGIRQRSEEQAAE